MSQLSAEVEALLDEFLVDTDDADVLGHLLLAHPHSLSATRIAHELDWEHTPEVFAALWRLADAGLVSYTTRYWAEHDLLWQAWCATAASIPDLRARLVATALPEREPAVTIPDHMEASA